MKFLFAQFDVPLDVFDNHDGVVDDSTDRNGDRANGEDVEAEIARPHADEGQQN